METAFFLHDSIEYKFSFCDVNNCYQYRLYHSIMFNRSKKVFIPVFAVVLSVHNINLLCCRCFPVVKILFEYFFELNGDVIEYGFVFFELLAEYAPNPYGKFGIVIINAEFRIDQHQREGDGVEDVSCI